MTRQTVVVMLAMTLLMGVVLSAVFTWQSSGFTSGFIGQWAWRFVNTYPVVLPTVLLVAPIAQRLANRIDRALGGGSPPSGDVEVALAAWRANAAGHRGECFDDWLAFLAPYVSLAMAHGPFRGVSDGIEKTREITALIATSEPRLIYDEPLRVSASPGCVVIKFAGAGTIAGRPFRNQMATSFDIRDGKVAAYREYFGEVDPDVLAMMNRTEEAPFSHPRSRRPPG